MKNHLALLFAITVTEAAILTFLVLGLISYWAEC